ncbi:MAG: hypothetical protein JSS02_16550 [Planctomycetes bacterium]|nr:hypothetical protein [Planctomycetota bacterium]
MPDALWASRLVPGRETGEHLLSQGVAMLRVGLIVARQVVQEPLKFVF